MLMKMFREKKTIIGNVSTNEIEDDLNNFWLWLPFSEFKELKNITKVPTYFSTEFDDVEEYEKLINKK